MMVFLIDLLIKSKKVNILILYMDINITYIFYLTWTKNLNSVIIVKHNLYYLLIIILFIHIICAIVTFYNLSF
jgi:hypothetical protein